jgi:AmmeMemoRadiSam system protein B
MKWLWEDLSFHETINLPVAGAPDWFCLQGEAMISTSERPRLRPFLAVAPDPRAPSYYYVWDQLGLSRARHRLSPIEFLCLELLDGRHSLPDIQIAVMRRLGGVLLPLETFRRLVQRLDEDLFLEGPRFRQVVSAPVRQPRCIGCYEGEPTALRRQLERLFTGPGGPGLPQQRRPDGALRAALLPHIDYPRGGVTYAWGYKEVFERADASLFVIIGTSHYSSHRFSLTRKNFQTPLGITPTDQDHIDRLVKHYGEGLFDDELLAHLPEHSIELEVVFLQYLYEKVRPIRIVPLVVGSFHDSVLLGSSPQLRVDVSRMVEALQRAESEAGEPVCYLISGDLAHLGPKFGDAAPVYQSQLERSRLQDQVLLKQAERADPAGFFQIIADEGDARRICGLPPTWTALAAARPACGKVLHYDQYVHPRGYESVSFASVAFYR